jgi:hypothetical protein
MGEYHTMITKILILALAATVATVSANETASGEKPKRERRGPAGEEGGRDRGPNFERAGLTKEEAEKVKAAMAATKEDATVVAAREAVKQAMAAVKAAKEAGQSREEIQPLMEAVREAGKAAMQAHVAAALATDSSLQASFDKLKAARAEKGEGRDSKGPRPERKKDKGQKQDA